MPVSKIEWIVWNLTFYMGIFEIVLLKSGSILIQQQAAKHAPLYFEKSYKQLAQNFPIDRYLPRFNLLIPLSLSQFLAHVSPENGTVT